MKVIQLTTPRPDSSDEFFLEESYLKDRILNLRDELQVLSEQAKVLEIENANLRKMMTDEIEIAKEPSRCVKCARITAIALFIITYAAGSILATAAVTLGFGSFLLKPHGKF